VQRTAGPMCPATSTILVARMICIGSARAAADAADVARELGANSGAGEGSPETRPKPGERVRIDRAASSASRRCARGGAASPNPKTSD